MKMGPATVDGSQEGSVGSLDSCNARSDFGSVLAERERDLAENNVENQDVELSLAYVDLRKHATAKTLSLEDTEQYKIRYRTMHEIILRAHKEERDVLREVKSLNSECLSEQDRLDKARAAHQAFLSDVRKLEAQRDGNDADLQELERRETTLRYEVDELQATFEELNYQLEDLAEENGRLVNPELDRLETIVREFKSQVDRLGSEINKDNALKETLLGRLKALDDTKVTLTKTQEIVQAQVAKSSGEPDRIRKQASSVQKAASNLEAEEQRMREKIEETVTETEAIRQKRQEAEEMKKSLIDKLALQRETLQHRQKDVEVVTKNLELERAKNHHLLTERVEIDLAAKEAEVSSRQEGDSLSMERKRLNTLKRKLRKKRTIAEAAAQVIPVLEQQARDVEEDLAAQGREEKDLANQITVLKQDVDIGLARFLAQDVKETAKREELATLLGETDALEAEVAQWVEEEKRQQQLISLLKGQRDLKQSEAIRVQQLEKETTQQIKMKSLVIAHLSKRCNDTNNRLKEFSALYDVVKNERNKYVNLIQASHQALAEMKEKIKILQNEVEILRNEALAKDKALQKERMAHRTSQARRDSLRVEANNASMQYRAKHQVVEQQIVEIEKQNSVINALEREMLRLKTMYETAVEQRNFAGVQVIDRNDELCVLYEKSNIQETTLTEGTLAIRKREEDIRTLKLQVAELERCLEATRRRKEKAPNETDHLVAVHEELQAKRSETEKLSMDLENPTNQARWRTTEGECPDVEQLQSTITVLEDRLNKKKECLLEKELVLEEVASLTRQLRKQATDGRAEALQLSKKVNEFQARIRDTTRRMMATVSELSMHQATALKLQQEKLARERELQEATWRAEHGEPPSEEAVWELHRLEQKSVEFEAQKLERAEAEAAGQAPIPPSMVRTTAEPRPNAYIPDDLGIPKPYGGSGPFKPTEPGTTMRHIRLPRSKEIEI